MSHSTPQFVPHNARLRRARLWPLFWLIPIGILAGVLSGALMNGFNGWLSPLHFQRSPIVNSGIWPEYWLQVVEPGMTEGAVLGSSLAASGSASIGANISVNLRRELKADNQLTAHAAKRSKWTLL